MSKNKIINGVSDLDLERAEVHDILIIRSKNGGICYYLSVELESHV